MAVQFSQEEVGEVTVLRLAGRMDAATSSAVDTKVASLIEDGATKLVFNLKGVAYLSSAGMRVILAASKKLDGKFALAEVVPEVFEVLKMAGFDKILEIAKSEQEAIASL